MKQNRDDRRSSFDSGSRRGEGSWAALGAATVLVVVLIGIVSTYLWVKGRIGGGATQVAPTLKWESFSPPGANFRVDTPGTPASQDIPGVAGSHLYFARTSPPAAMTFMVQFVELSPGGDGSSDRGGLDATRHYFWRQLRCVSSVSAAMTTSGAMGR